MENCLMSDWWAKKLAGETPKQQRPDEIQRRIESQSYTDTQRVQQNNQPVAKPLPTDNVSMGQAIRMWQGGEAMRREGDKRCPECGSANVFSRVGKGSNTMVNGAHPAPRCFNCGWNGIYSQATEATWTTT